MFYKDVTGMKSGRLTALRYVGSHKITRHALFECLCECGRLCIVPGTRIATGARISCGCIRDEALPRARHRWWEMQKEEREAQGQ